MPIPLWNFGYMSVLGYIRVLWEASYMLLIYLDQLMTPQTKLLHTWHPKVHYWPRSSPITEEDVVTDWWILFSHVGLADIWILRYPEHTRVCRTLFD